MRQQRDPRLAKLGSRPRNFPSVVRLDAKRFRFEDGTFNYVFCEHLIEHLTFPEGLHMLLECYRVLMAHGKIRISTPDLLFLIGLHGEDKSEVERGYIRWSSENHIKFAPYHDGTFVINNFMRDWGHKFIYDEKTLRFCLEKAGFREVKRCSINESETDELRNLECESRMPPDYLRLESMILEATKE